MDTQSVRDDSSLQSRAKWVSARCGNRAIIPVGPYKNVQNPYMITITTDRGDSRQCFLELLIAWIMLSMVLYVTPKFEAPSLRLSIIKVDHSPTDITISPTVSLELLS